MRLLSAVMGTDSDEARMRESQKLLSYGFRYFQTQLLYGVDAPLTSREVWYGDGDDVAMGVSEPVYVTIPRGRYDDLQATLDIPRLIEAPIDAGEQLGELRVTLDDELVVSVPLVARGAVAQANVFTRLGHGVYLFFRELFQ